MTGVFVATHRICPLMHSGNMALMLASVLKWVHPKEVSVSHLLKILTSLYSCPEEAQNSQFKDEG